MNITFNLFDGSRIEKKISSQSCLIGRSPKCDVVISVDGISRRHCQIELINGEVFVTDLESTNGVFIEGERIPANQPTLYQTFLTLSFGPVTSVVIERDDATKVFTHTPSPKNPVSNDKGPTVTTSTNASDKAKAPAATIHNPGTLKKKSDDGKKKNLFIIILIIIVVGAIIWWNIKHRSYKRAHTLEVQEKSAAQAILDGDEDY